MRKLALVNIPTIASLPFQLTTSRGGRHVEFPKSLFCRYFNSRPHEEVDSFSSLLTFSEYVFQLTTSRGGRLLAAPLKIFTSAISTHDLTRRSTLCSFPLCFSFRYFNSRPHEEVDKDTVLPTVQARTFQLTTSRGGRLRRGSIDARELRISTHDLTRRSTRLPV